MKKLLKSLCGLLVLTGCASSTVVSDLPAGSWGAEGVKVEISAREMYVELNCAHAGTSQKITLDARGHFRQPGTYTPESGIARLHQTATTVPAELSGTYKNARLTFTIQVEGLPTPLGPYTVQKGVQPRLIKCF